MSNPPAQHPVPGVVTFTERGNAALDTLSATLAAACDGSPASIADVFEYVMEADIEDLAEALKRAGGTSATKEAAAQPEEADLGHSPETEIAQVHRSDHQHDHTDSAASQRPQLDHRRGPRR